MLALLSASDSQNAQFGDYLVTGAGGFCTLVCGAYLARPGSLTLAPDGLTLALPVRSQHWSWSEIGNFRAGSFGSISCEIRTGGNAAAKGRTGALGFGWEGGAAAAVATLDAAHERWSAA